MKRYSMLSGEMIEVPEKRVVEDPLPPQAVDLLSEKIDAMGRSVTEASKASQAETAQALLDIMAAVKGFTQQLSAIRIPEPNIAPVMVGFDQVINHLGTELQAITARLEGVESAVVQAIKDIPQGPSEIVFDVRRDGLNKVDKIIARGKT